MDPVRYFFLLSRRSKWRLPQAVNARVAMACGGKVVTSAQRRNSAVIGDGRDLRLGYYANSSSNRRRKTRFQ